MINTAMRTALLLLIFLFGNAAANSNNVKSKAEFQLPPNFQSTYQVEKYNTNVGEMHNTLTYRNGSINYYSIAKAKGLAALFVSAEPTELSILNWPETAALTLPQQQSFNFVQEEEHKRNQHIEFKLLATGETLVEGSYKFKPYSLKTNEKVWSRQLLLLLISSDFQLNPNISSNNFFIADKGHINKFTYTVLGNEAIDYQGKTLATVKIKIIKENSKRFSYAWLSKTQFYLPLKIEQYKGEDLNVRMRLTQLKLNK